MEKIVTRACLSQHDEHEREWLTTVRAILHGLRARTGEAAAALREFDEDEDATGWRTAQESTGVRTDWRPASDGSLWLRMTGVTR